MTYETYEVRVYSDGEKHWYLEGKLHRTDGPAVEHPNGEKHWYLEGKRHRTDGPAIEYSDGTKYWCLEGKSHRTDGPAVEHPDGEKHWYLEGKKYSQEDWEKLVSPKESCEGKIVEIDGKKYKLMGLK